MKLQNTLLITVILSITFFSNCKKDGSDILVAIESFSPSTEGPGAKVTIKGFGFGNLANEVQLTFNETNAVIKSISDSVLITEVPVNATTGKITIRNVKGKATSQTDFIILKGQWKQMADLPGPGRDAAVSFVIGNKGYIGTGFSSNQGKLKDFYVYDPAGNSWTRIADIPAQVRAEAVGFSILNKGYVISGSDIYKSLKEVWEYDPVSNTWTRKADFPGSTRLEAAAFAIGARGYMGTGWTEISPNPQQLKDWWEYDPVSDKWTQKKDFPGGTRNFATALSNGTAGYLGLGASEIDGLLNDWWEYQPATDTWIRKKDFPGRKRICAGGFCIGTKCYVGNGYDGLAVNDPDKIILDWWEYDISADIWTQKTSQIEDRLWGSGFTINSIGYFGFGFSHNSGYLKDFWEFRPF